MLPSKGTRDTNMKLCVKRRQDGRTQSKWLKKELEALIELFERAKYSQLAFSEVEYQTSEPINYSLKEQMK